MEVPVNRLKKAEILWLANHRCRHGHSYLSHYSCYLKEMPDGSPLDLKIGFFDIESFNLKANVGVLFGYCIKEYGSPQIHEDWLRGDDFKTGSIPDSRVVKRCAEDLRKFDVIVTYFGTRFDIPYVRTKCLMNDIDFPEYGEIVHLDLYYMVKSKLSLTRNSLDVACETVLGHSDKTRVEPKLWIKALYGDLKAIEYIAEHCRIDVDLTEKLYDKLIPFRKRIDRSA